MPRRAYHILAAPHLRRGMRALFAPHSNNATHREERSIPVVWLYSTALTSTLIEFRRLNEILIKRDEIIKADFDSILVETHSKKLENQLAIDLVFFRRMPPIKYIRMLALQFIIKA